MCSSISYRYHEFREIWDNQKAPGEKTRSQLRWHIRVWTVYNIDLCLHYVHRNSSSYKTHLFMYPVIVSDVLVIMSYQQRKRDKLYDGKYDIS